jgi:hypothetical protein
VAVSVRTLQTAERGGFEKFRKSGHILTPVCSANHVPEYIQKLPELRAKGVDQVAVLAYNL